MRQDWLTRVWFTRAWLKHTSALLATTALLYNVGAAAQLPEKVGETTLPSLAPIVKKASPAVVNIATRGTVREQRPRNPLLEDPFFRRFFDAPELGPRERQFQSAGSGVIVDAKNGYIRPEERRGGERGEEAGVEYEE